MYIQENISNYKFAPLKLKFEYLPSKYLELGIYPYKFEIWISIHQYIIVLDISP
jgi:hypothetical protein